MCRWIILFKTKSIKSSLKFRQLAFSNPCTLSVNCFLFFFWWPEKMKLNSTLLNLVFNTYIMKEKTQNIAKFIMFNGYLFWIPNQINYMFSFFVFNNYRNTHVPMFQVLKGVTQAKSSPTFLGLPIAQRSWTHMKIHCFRY